MKALFLSLRVLEPTSPVFMEEAHVIDLIFFGLVIVVFVLCSLFAGRFIVPHGGQVPSTDLLFALKASKPKAIAKNWQAWVSKRAGKNPLPAWAKPMNPNLVRYGKDFGRDLEELRTIKKADAFDATTVANAVGIKAHEAVEEHLSADPVESVTAPDLTAF